METVYSLGGPCKTIEQIVCLSPKDMANELREMDYLKEQLNNITQSVYSNNWDDIAESWFTLGNLYKSAGSELGVNLAEVIGNHRHTEICLGIKHIW